MRVELESITNGSRSPGNSTSQWGPHQSHYSPNMGTSNNGMPKVKIIVPEFDGSDEREATRWVNKIEQYFRYYQISDDEEKINVASIHQDKDESSRSHTDENHHQKSTLNPRNRGEQPISRPSNGTSLMFKDRSHSWDTCYCDCRQMTGTDKNEPMSSLKKITILNSLHKTPRERCQTSMTMMKERVRALPFDG
jgi:hypothetical protein